MRGRWKLYAAVACFVLLLLMGGCARSAPVETHSLHVACGGIYPEATDFLVGGAQGRKVSFAVVPDFSTPGEQVVQLLVDGRSVEAECLVIEDRTPPVLSGVCDRSVLLGEGAVLRAGVTASDDCFGDVSWELDASALDTTREGFYAVYYRAVDASGNVTERMAYVTVYAEEVTQAQLDAACDDFLAPLLVEGMSREETCRAIYAALQETIDYRPISDKTSPVRAAYHALFRDGYGDCYSYFAAACALLSRAGVEYLTIERSHAEGEETHYWLMVNLAQAGEGARWYHFDPTELDTGGFAHDGCLFTDAELQAYNAYNVGFYDYDRVGYPESATESLR